MIEKIKENWFVVLVACILVAAIGYYTIDTNKGKLPGKKTDGKDVVMSIGDVDYYADDLYTELYGDAASSTSVGTQVLFSQFEKYVVDNAIKADSDMKVQIASAVTGTKQQYSGYESQLTAQLQAAGYSGIDDLEAYFTHYFKLKKIIEDAYEKDIENLFSSVYEKASPRTVSHILVKISDFDKITEKEQKKLDDIDQALKDGKEFSEIAKEYSDDGSASDGGYLGYMDKNTSYVTEFKEAALKTEKGQMTDWVKTQYGYHRILVNETDKDALLADKENRDGIYQAIESAHPELNAQIIWDTAQNMGVTFASEEIENAIKGYLGIGEE